MDRKVNRRQFLQGMTHAAGALSLGGALASAGPLALGADESSRPDYRGPNVVIIRFGGGVRRRESIDPENTYSPYLVHELFPRGVLFPRVEIDSTLGVETSHGQGTLHVLTGKYQAYTDANKRFARDRFEPDVPTLFEYLRKSFAVPQSQTLIVNGEDRIDEEFYSFSNHHLFGVDYRSNVLSLYRFKVYLLRQQLQEGMWQGQELKQKQNELQQMLALDRRASDPDAQAVELGRFWERWRKFYGDSGLVNPRGDRVLTELAVRAIRELRPKLMMVNYNDCDYVHWGFMSHYTRGIQIMDEGIKQIVAEVEADEEYRGNTIFVVVPDCGRDSNRLVAVPCQHHFGSRSSHEIFAFLFGSGVPKGRVIDKKVDQISVAATVGRLMSFPTEFADGPALEEAIA